MGELSISTHITIQNNSVYLNGKEWFSAEKNLEFGKFAKLLYKQENLNYAKFFKMDSLSKLGFLAAEILLNKPEKKEFDPENTAIILANASSSIHTDKKYQETISDIPSPAVFVYTLPNIVIGEISIRNEIKGEAAFFIQQQFDFVFMENYIAQLFAMGKTKNCIAGWLDYNLEDNFNAFLCWIGGEKKDNDIALTSGNLQSLCTINELK